LAYTRVPLPAAGVGFITAAAAVAAGGAAAGGAALEQAASSEPPTATPLSRTAERKKPRRESIR
jgi:hypothetical protein